MESIGVLFTRFGLALILGFLIGLERERDKPARFAGMRTFALISLLGAVLAFASTQFTGYWLFIAGFAAVTALALNAQRFEYAEGRPGITTEVAFMVCFMLGALVYWDMLPIAAAITVAVILILTFKPTLQQFRDNVDRQDIWAGLEFAFVSVIVLPVLPNESFGPFDIFNPREIWLMVVLVAAINLAGYILSQVYGAQRSIGVTGVLGGMISSTAVTFEFARRSSSKKEKKYAAIFALAIAIASTGMFLRVLIIAFVLNPLLGLTLLLPMLAGMGISLLGVWLLWRQIKHDEEGPQKMKKGRRSPFALKPAFQFGVIYALILLVSKAAQIYLGDMGTYISSVIGGVAGMDAVTLSMAKLSLDSLPIAIAARSVAMGAAANMLFKGGAAYVLGQGAVRRELIPLFIMAGAVSTTAVFLLT